MPKASVCAKKCKGKKQPAFGKCMKKCFSGKKRRRSAPKLGSSRRSKCPKIICKTTPSGRACRYKRVFPK